MRFNLVRSNTTHLLLDTPYRDGICNIQAAFKRNALDAKVNTVSKSIPTNAAPAKISLKERVAKFFVGIFLCIPIFNIVIDLALRRLQLHAKKATHSSTAPSQGAKKATHPSTVPSQGPKPSHEIETEFFSTCGMVNGGNRCWMISTIQAIIHTPCLKKAIINDDLQLRPGEDEHSLALRKLLKEFVLQEKARESKKDAFGKTKTSPIEVTDALVSEAIYRVASVAGIREQQDNYNLLSWAMETYEQPLIANYDLKLDFLMHLSSNEPFLTKMDNYELKDPQDELAPLKDLAASFRAFNAFGALPQEQKGGGIEKEKGRILKQKIDDFKEWLRKSNITTPQELQNFLQKRGISVEIQDTEKKSKEEIFPALIQLPALLSSKREILDLVKLKAKGSKGLDTDNANITNERFKAAPKTMAFGRYAPSFTDPLQTGKCRDYPSEFTVPGELFEDGKQQTYRLKSIICRIGDTIQGGHYKTFSIKNGKEFWEFNDATAKQITEREFYEANAWSAIYERVD